MKPTRRAKREGTFALLAVLAAIAFLFPSAQAYVSSQEALNHVCVNAYLSSKECSQAQIELSSRISFSSKQYWLITIFSGDSPSGFIAVEDSKAGAVVPTAQATNVPLFKTMDALRSLSTARQRFSEQKQWLLTNSNAQFFSDLSRFLSNEKADLEIIRADSNSGEIYAKIDSMKQELDSLSAQATAISSLITEAIGFESTYFLDPDASNLAQLKQTYDSAFEPMEAFKQAAIEYDSMVRELKSLVSTSNLSTDQKAQFVSLADAPSQLYQITSVASTASSNQQSVSSAFQGAESRAADLAQNLSLRIDRSRAYSAIYKEDQLLSSSTAKTYTILKAAYGDITSEAKKELWNNQDKVSALQSDYPKAVQAYEAGKYPDALSYAGKAKEEVVSIYRDGVASQEQGPGTIDLGAYTMPAIAGLIILLVALFLYSNRNKLFGKAEGSEEGEGNAPKGF